MGRLSDGTLVASLTPEALAARYRHGARTHLRFACGAELEGELEATTQNSRGQITTARFKDYVLHSEREAGFREAGPSYLLCAASEVVSAHAGAIDPAFFPESEQLERPGAEAAVAPGRARACPARAVAERAAAAFSRAAGGSSVDWPRSGVDSRRAQRPFGDEQLLRWNLLESLCKLGERGRVRRARSKAEPGACEIRFSHSEPIATGLALSGVPGRLVSREIFWGPNRRDLLGSDVPAGPVPYLAGRPRMLRAPERQHESFS